MGSVHAGFLELDILVLDDSPVKYLNIDRERLKDGAIDEEDIMAIRKTVMENWCKYFCGQSGSTGSIIKRFSGNPGILMSLFLLFYQDVSKECFDEFKSKFQSAIESMNMVLGDEQINVSDLWNENKTFRTIIEIGYELRSYKERKEEQVENTIGEIETKHNSADKYDVDLEQKLSSEQQKDDNDININVDLVRHLPHRLINIESINCNSDNTFTYRFKVKNPEDAVNSIEMDDDACLWDYIATFAKKVGGKWKFNFQDIQKKVFKPNKAYESLVISRFPNTFRKGFNFASEMDYCIGAYILSPFDRKSADMLKKSIDKKKNGLCEFKKYVLEESIQLKKCINYILKIRHNKDVEMEETVYKEYEKFVEDFYEMVFKHFNKNFNI